MPSTLTLCQDRLPAKGVATTDDFDWEAFKADVKRVRSIPYREETLCPFQERDDWLDRPEYMRRDPRNFS